MKDVYIKNPQMGDAASVDLKLAELGQNLEKLRLEAQKFEVRGCRRDRSKATDRQVWEGTFEIIQPSLLHEESCPLVPPA